MLCSHYNHYLLRQWWWVHSPSSIFIRTWDITFYIASSYAETQWCLKKKISTHCRDGSHITTSSIGSQDPLAIFFPNSSVSNQPPSHANPSSHVSLSQAVWPATKLSKAQNLRFLVLSLASSLHDKQATRPVSSLCFRRVLALLKCIFLLTHSVGAPLCLTPCWICGVSLSVCNTTYTSSNTTHLSDNPLSANHHTTHTADTRTSSVDNSTPIFRIS